MPTFSKLKQPSKEFRDYINESHIAHKKRAESHQVSSKNHKRIVELIDIQDDEVDAELYARYIR